MLISRVHTTEVPHLEEGITKIMVFFPGFETLVWCKKEEKEFEKPGSHRSDTVEVSITVLDRPCRHI